MSRSNPRLVSCRQIAGELGWTPRELRASQRRRAILWSSYQRGAITEVATYDAELIEVLRALAGQGFREVAKPGEDFLNRYLKGLT